MGRLTRNPDVRYSNGAEPTAIAKFTLAVDRRYKREGDATADFISCLAFGKVGQFIEKYCQQGTKLCVEGRISTGSYIKQDGSKVYTTDVVVEHAEFAESRATQQEQPAPAPQAYQPQGYKPAQGMTPPTTYQQQSFQQAAQDGFMQIADDLQDEGLPFGR